VGVDRLRPREALTERYQSAPGEPSPMKIERDKRRAHLTGLGTKNCNSEKKVQDPRARPRPNQDIKKGEGEQVVELFEKGSRANWR